MGIVTWVLLLHAFALVVLLISLTLTEIESVVAATPVMNSSRIFSSTNLTNENLQMFCNATDTGNVIYELKIYKNSALIMEYNNTYVLEQDSENSSTPTDSWRYYDNVVDENWETKGYTFKSIGNDCGYIEYIKPANYFFNETIQWKKKYAISSTVNENSTHNLLTSCIQQQNINVSVCSSNNPTFANFTCYNGSEYVLIYDNLPGGAIKFFIFEEMLLWTLRNVYPNSTEHNIYNLSYNNISVGDNFTLSCRAYGTDYSSWMNSSILTILPDTVPPYSEDVLYSQRRLVNPPVWEDGSPDWVNKLFKIILQRLHDNVEISSIILSHNETGQWANDTLITGLSTIPSMQPANYHGNCSTISGIPATLPCYYLHYLTNFTYVKLVTFVRNNSNLSPGHSIGYQYHYNDSSNNWNSTPVLVVNYTNNVPTTGSVSITPSPASANQNLTCVATNFSDLDLDTLTYFYRWYNASSNGIVSLAQILGSGNTSIGDSWKCSVTAFDGYANSSWVNSSTLVINDLDAPSLTSMAIAPSSIANTATLNVSAECSDVQSYIDWAKFTMRNPLGVVFNRSFTIPSSVKATNISYLAFQTDETPTIGVWNITNFYCQDQSGNLNTTQSSLSFQIYIASTGGGGGGTTRIEVIEQVVVMVCNPNGVCEGVEDFFSCPQDCKPRLSQLFDKSSPGYLWRSAIFAKLTFALLALGIFYFFVLPRPRPRETKRRTD